MIVYEKKTMEYLPGLFCIKTSLKLGFRHCFHCQSISIYALATWVSSNWVMPYIFMLGPPPTNHPHTPCSKPVTSLNQTFVSHHSCTPPWPSQLRSMQVSSPVLNITLSHSRATGDSLGHSRVWCRVFRTNIAQNHKLINNFHKRNSKSWQQICFCTQWYHWKNYGDKWTWEIMKLMTQCVPVLCCWVDWHWLWGIDTIDRTKALSQ